MIGDIKGVPNDRMDARWTSITRKLIRMPYRPNAAAMMVMAIRSNDPASSKDGITNEAIAVPLTTTTMGAPIKPAATMVSPMTSAPTTPIVWPKRARRPDAGLTQNLEDDDHAQRLDRCRKRDALPGRGEGY